MQKAGKPKMRSTKQSLQPVELIERRIYLIRAQKVMLDAHLLSYIRSRHVHLFKQ